MDWLEQELKLALAREEPPPDLAAKVNRRRRPARVAYRWLAAAAALVLLAGAGEGYRWHRGMEAKRQAMLAFHIAGGELNHVRTHVLEVSQ